MAEETVKNKLMADTVPVGAAIGLAGYIEASLATVLVLHDMLDSLLVPSGDHHGVMYRQGGYAYAQALGIFSAGWIRDFPANEYEFYSEKPWILA